MTTAEQFLNRESGIIELPNGSKVFAAAIGRNKLQLIPKRAVEWIVYDSSGKMILKRYSRIGVATLPIDNSYVSKTSRKLILETSLPDQLVMIAKTESGDFEGSTLESLPTVDQEIKTAGVRSEAANEPSDIDKLKQIGIALVVGVVLIMALKK